MNNIWGENIKAPIFKSLDKDISTDVLIIGGGMCGLLCSYMLSSAGIDNVVVEKNGICSGISGDTTAKITVQHGFIYSYLCEKFGFDTAYAYYKANLDALEFYKKICSDIECDFEIKDAYAYSTEDRDAIRKEIDALKKFGCDAFYSKCERLPFETVGGVQISGQAQFNPLKFAFKISENLSIYENTDVTELKDGYALSNGHKIKSEKIIVATHFPFINKHGAYFLKMYQYRSYVLAIKNATDIGGMYIDGNGGISLKNYKDYIFIGGSGHRTGKGGCGWDDLFNFAKKYFPGSYEAYRFATQDCITLDKMPYIGQYSAKTPNFYVATGFNKWGMTWSMAAAKMLCDIIFENDNSYVSFFSPSRSIFHPGLAVNTFEAITNLISFSKKRCPHMGCALKRNKYEHSWDCPCHGSRFDANGKLLDNPSTSNLKK